MPNEMYVPTRATNDAGILGYNNGYTAGQDSANTGLGYAQLGLSGLAALGNIWSANEQNKIAKDTLDFNKESFTKNFALYQADRARRVNRENSIDRQMAELNGRKYTDINAGSEKAKDAAILAA